jgi:hypothetical protein
MIIGGILLVALKEIFSPSNKIYREVGRAMDLSASRFMHQHFKVFISTELMMT